MANKDSTFEVFQAFNGLLKALNKKVPSNDVALEVSQLLISSLKCAQAGLQPRAGQAQYEQNRYEKSLTCETSHAPIGPYLAKALDVLVHTTSRASSRELRLVNTCGSSVLCGTRGGGGDGDGGGGTCDSSSLAGFVFRSGLPRSPAQSASFSLC